MNDDQNPPVVAIAPMPAELRAERVVDIATERFLRRPDQPIAAVPHKALHRYNDLARQMHVHESRPPSPFEVHAVIWQPELLGLGHGALASLALNPAV